MNDDQADRILVAWGLLSLLLWASVGLLLETALGLRWAPYLDDDLSRELLRLGHAHGAAVSLIALVIGYRARSFREDTRALRRLFLAAMLLMPTGFTLSAVDHPPGEPGAAIFLVPAGAVALLSALAIAALGAFRGTREAGSDESMDG